MGVKFTIKKNGQVTADAVNITGSGCESLIDHVTAAIDLKPSSDPVKKPEFYETESEGELA